MIFGYFTLLVALLIEIVGAYYSITGLAAIFSGAVVPILIMGGSLELGKVTAAVWLKNNWERAGLQYKFYLVPAVAMLMLITSMGIFGYLSKAHNDQNLVSGDVQSKIAIYDEKIKTAKENIESDRKQLKQMDEAVDQVMGRSTDEKGADKANAIRKSQQRDRVSLAKDIEANQKIIASLNDQAAPIRAEVRKVEAEVGPIKYIAKLIYDDNPDANILEKAVTWVIMIIVAVFDPLALVLILAAQQTLKWAREDQEDKESDILIREELEELERDLSTVKTEEPPPEVFDDTPDFEGVRMPNGEWLQTGPKFDPGTLPAQRIPPEHEYFIIEDADDEEFDEYPYRGKGVAPSIPMSASYEQPEVKEEPELITRIAHPESNVEVAPNPTVMDERPGDYIEPPLEFEPTIDLPPPKPDNPEAAPAPNRRVMNSHLMAEADNVMPDSQPARSDFGNLFPINPNKGDTYLRTDYLPNRLFKFNGQKWIQVDKDSTDVYAYEDRYIQHLIEELESGRYDADMLSDLEQQQIKNYLEKNA